MRLQVWLVGDGLTAQEQEMAQPGVHFVPYSQFPPMNTRGDCVYHSTPALVVPDSYENMHACEVTRNERTILSIDQSFARASRSIKCLA